jgi:hypothetical protein
MLHVYTDGVDTVVAWSEDDARAVMREAYGHEADNVKLRSVADALLFAIRLDDAPGVDAGCCAGHGHRHKRGCPLGFPLRTAREWADMTGRGLLCSVEV